MVEQSSQPRTRPRHRRAGRRDSTLASLLIAAGYLVLAIICYWNLWSTDVTRISIPDGDQYLNMWYLTWTPFALLHGHNPFFSDYVNYPYGANLLTNTGVPLLGVLATPVTLLWGPIASFNVLLTLSLAVSAFAGYVFVHHWVRWRPAALLGGLVYGFSPYEIAQGWGHLNLVFIPFPPLILLCAYRILVEDPHPRPRDGVILAILVCCQFFVSTEILADTVVIALIGLVLLAVVGRHHLRARVRASGKTLGAAAGITVAVLAYPTWFAIAGPGSITGPIQLVAQAYRADLLGPVVPTGFQAIAPSALVRVSSVFAGNGVENGSYLGITLVAVVLIAFVVLWRNLVVRLAVVLCLSAFVLTLGDHLVVKAPSATTASGLVLPGWLLFHLPLYANAVPVRISLFVALFAALVFAIALESLRDWIRARPALPRWVGLAGPAFLGLVVLVPLVPAVPYGGVADVSAPRFYTSGIGRIVPRGAPIVTYPYAGSSFATPMVWQAQTFMHFRMPGGNLLVPSPTGQLQWSSLGSDRVTEVAEVFTQLAEGSVPARTVAVRTALDGELAALRADAVVATPSDGADPAQATRYLTWLLGRPSAVEGATVVWLLTGRHDP